MKQWRICLLSSFLLSACAVSTSNYKSRPSQQVKLLLTPQYKICILGDTGTGGAGQYLVAKALEQEECSHIRILGDLIYPLGLRNRRDTQIQSKFFRPYNKLLEQTNFYLAVGNHDHYGDVSPWLRQAKQHQHIYLPYFYYSEKWQDVCIFTIDTYVYDSWSSKNYRQKQIDWLQTQFRELTPSCKFSLVLGHHPFLSHGQHGNAKGLLNHFLKREIIGKVDLYIAGHDHNLSDEGSVQKTRLLVSGAGAKLRPLKNPPKIFGQSQLGYLVLYFRRSPQTGVVAEYTFKGIAKGSNRKNVQVETLHSGKVYGRGIRP